MDQNLKHSMPKLPEQTCDNVPDLIHIDKPSPILIKSHEDPVKFVIFGIQNFYILSLLQKESYRGLKHA